MKAAVLKIGIKILVAGTTLVASLSYAAHDPVIMIPGMGGWVSLMDPMKSSLQANGWPSNILFTWTDADQMNKDMEASARAISAKVDQVLAQTGAQKVVLATWSASTIAGRYYIKNLGGDQKVSQFISFAGPHHGISIWQQCAQTATACRNQWGPIPNTAWLNALNSGTEVPGSPTVKYLTLRGSADTNATPVDTAMLAGADENYLQSGLNHNTIITDATALKKMRDFIIKNESGASTTTTSIGGTTTTTPATTTSTTVPVSTCYKSSNSAHVTAGRATNVWGSAYAKGSNQYMGYNSLYIITKLRQTGPSYYKIDNTCP